MPTTSDHPGPGPDRGADREGAPTADENRRDTVRLDVRPAVPDGRRDPGRPGLRPAAPSARRITGASSKLRLPTRLTGQPMSRVRRGHQLLAK